MKIMYCVLSKTTETASISAAAYILLRRWRMFNHREELLCFGERDDLKHPPKDLEASGIYRSAFCAETTCLIAKQRAWPSIIWNLPPCALRLQQKGRCWNISPEEHSWVITCHDVHASSDVAKGSLN
jgi:hypothetical protein